MKTFKCDDCEDYETGIPDEATGMMCGCGGEMYEVDPDTHEVKE